MTSRRYPIADQESGIAVGFVLFAGSLLDFHMFKLIDGRIFALGDGSDGIRASVSVAHVVDKPPNVPR